MKADMHIHTKYSYDSTASPEKIVRNAVKRGIDCIAVTDHNTTKSWKAMNSAAKLAGIKLIRGEEINVFIEGKKAGEILGYFLNEKIKPGDPLSVIDSIRSQGGISSIAHPFDRGGNLFLFPDVVKRVDAIEVFNSRVIFSKRNRMASVLAQDNKKGLTAGSDAHSPIEVGRAYIKHPTEDVEELRKAILKAKVSVVGKKSCFCVHAISTYSKILKKCLKSV